MWVGMGIGPVGGRELRRPYPLTDTAQWKRHPTMCLFCQVVLWYHQLQIICMIFGL